MDLDETLLARFGLAAFRPGQRAVIESVLAGRPTVAVMPTGAGKSLCYQLPAVATGGTALVVSPLVALIKDQVDALTARGIPAGAVIGGMAPAEQAARLDDLAAGRLRLLYVAPERFKSPRFEEALARAPLSLLAIDEAHCISEWGHDFRPDYARLGEICARFRPPRLLALTATATPEVRRDIVRALGMRDPLVLVRGFDRPNLSFRVDRVGSAVERRRQLLHHVGAARGTGAILVYAATRKNAEGYADELTGAGLRAAAYHAGLDDDRRARVHDAFMKGALDALVATNAFGMGVNKADVRLVLHADLPRSPEAYYQEAGRAGRDGAQAACVLLFQHADVRLQEALIDQGTPPIDLLRAVWRALKEDPRRGASTAALRRALPGSATDGAIGGATRFLVKAGYLRDSGGVVEVRRASDGGPAPAPLDATALAARADVERQKLRSMVDYAYATGCRRRFLLAYFGDADAEELRNCRSCDVCERGPAAALDEDDQARVRAALTLVGRLRGRFGRTRVAQVLAGSDDDPRFEDAPERGVLRGKGERYTLDLLRAMEGAGLLEASRGEYPTVSLTRLGDRVRDGEEEVALCLPAPRAPRRPRLGTPPPPPAPAAPSRATARASSVAAGVTPAAPATPSPSGAPAAAPSSSDLIERLQLLRRDLARREAVPPYVIFTNRTLDALAAQRPATLDALATVAGIGPARLERYGASILALLTGEA